jgi:paired amphipathic helix protein Sin3a
MIRELKVEDALLYLDQVKVEFGDQPHIYNEFLDIMKTFKTQQIDTPGVIRRVSNLFQGNPRLVLGFNTFLPEGYKIELDGDGPPIAVYRQPGSNITHVLSNTGPTTMRVLQRDQPNNPAFAHAAPPPRGHPTGPLQPKGREMNVQQLPPGAQQQQQQPNMYPYARPPIQRPPPPQARAPPNLQPEQQQQLRSLPVEQQQQQVRVIRQPPPRPEQRQLHEPPPPPQPAVVQQQHQQQQQQQQGEPQGPLEFDHAINYVTTIKKRFSNEPYTYKKFLEILHTYQKEQRGIKEVLDEVSTLFADHPDLLREFTFFLPDGVQAQAKAQLDVVANESEARNLALRATKANSTAARPAAARAAPREARPAERQQMPAPLFQTPGRSPERETNIIRSAQYGVVSFAPVRPPRKNDLTPAQAAQKYGRPRAIPELPTLPRTFETTFFERAKQHLNRRELQADKPGNQKRHTPYAEFLKCLHLFGAGIVNKDELTVLLKGLFMQGHSPKTGANASGGHYNPAIANEANALIRDFEEILIGRGPFADQEAALKDKSKYGGRKRREFDYSECEQVSSSYFQYPSDYPHDLFLSNPGQTEHDTTVLNNIVVCVGEQGASKRPWDDLEGYDVLRVRRNAYEYTLFRLEDERFEVDMAIERNAQAMRQIEPFAEEVQALRIQEEKENQPIGRLQYQLSRYALNTIHINAIGRMYGEKGDEVLQHLAQNPLVVLPIIYQRLKQKDIEWRNAKVELRDQWNALQAANYEGTLDVKCYFHRKDLERTFSKVMLLDECRKARTYCVYPERQKVSAVTRSFVPDYSMSCDDPGAVLYQPHSIVKCSMNSSLKNVVHLIMQQVKVTKGVSSFDRERIGRIWAEFMSPFFQYPVEWIAEEVRTSFGGKLNPSIVKCK